MLPLARKGGVVMETANSVGADLLALVVFILISFLAIGFDSFKEKIKKRWQKKP